MLQVVGSGLAAGSSLHLGCFREDWAWFRGLRLALALHACFGFACAVCCALHCARSHVASQLCWPA